MTANSGADDVTAADWNGSRPARISSVGVPVVISKEYAVGTTSLPSGP